MERCSTRNDENATADPSTPLRSGRDDKFVEERTVNQQGILKAEAHAERSCSRRRYRSCDIVRGELPLDVSTALDEIIRQ